MGQLNGYCRARLLLLEIRNYLFTGVPASLRNTQRSGCSRLRYRYGHAKQQRGWLASLATLRIPNAKTFEPWFRPKSSGAAAASRVHLRKVDEMRF